MSASGGVIVVGSVNEDTVHRLPRFPLPGETIDALSTSRQLGGKGLNQAVAASRVGGRVTLVASVGDDAAGVDAIELLRTEQMNISGVHTSPNTRTGSAQVLVDGAGENMIILTAGANVADPHMASRARPFLGSSDILVVQGEVAEQSITLCADLAERAGARLVLNLAPFVRLADSTLALADPLIVNTGEARMTAAGWATDEHPDSAFDALRRRARSVVVTAGAEGARVWDGSRETRISARPVRAIDTTAAGDAFTGAVSARLAAGDDLVAACEIGNLIAAHAVAHRGSLNSYPSREQAQVLVALARSDRKAHHGYEEGTTSS